MAFRSLVLFSCSSVRCVWKLVFEPRSTTWKSSSSGTNAQCGYSIGLCVWLRHFWSTASSPDAAGGIIGDVVNRWSGTGQMVAVTWQSVKNHVEYFCSCIGHRGLIKNKKQTALKYVVSFRIFSYASQDTLSKVIKSTWFAYRKSNLFKNAKVHNVYHRCLCIIFDVVVSCDPYSRTYWGSPFKNPFSYFRHW